MHQYRAIPAQNEHTRGVCAAAMVAMVAAGLSVVSARRVDCVTQVHSTVCA
jgi:hypothetical protein